MSFQTGGKGKLTGDTVQTVSVFVATNPSGSVAIPLDGTTPQNNEGYEMFIGAITPKSASNKLKVEVLVNIGYESSNQVITAALFQDAVADAISVGAIYAGGSNNCIQIKIPILIMDAGTTNEITFKVRVGDTTGSKMTLNANQATAIFNGVMKSSIIITEIKA